LAYHVWFALILELLLAVNVKVAIFWNVPQCNVVDTCQWRGEIFFRVEDGECRWYWNLGTYIL
jgi:hypothetical protein